MHLQGGQAEQVGRCLVVNIASHDDPGAALRYALLEWTGRRLKTVEIGEERDRGELEGLVGLGPRGAEKLVAGGFRTIEDILEADYAALKRMFSRPEVARRVRAQARASLTRSPVVLDPTVTVDGDATIVDVETSFLQNDPWLVGYKRWGERRVSQMYELDPKAHRWHLRRVTEALSRGSHTRFLQWGPFDRGALQRAYATVNLVPGSWLQPDRWTNAGAWLARAIALPVPDYKLKTVGRYFGYRFAHPDVDGRQLGNWYSSHLESGTPMDLRKALAYNRDDVRVVQHILEMVTRLVAAKDAFVEPAVPVRRKRRRRVARVEMTPAARARAIADFMATRRRKLVGSD
ncbi:MAG TPA: ribonuclease H-like domain-containing protein [Polyangia bacterium]|nr:ribonuclease H-like domain-containing protein [Polyangia bacterium]